MSIIKVLDPAQSREFDKPPKFSYSQRKIMFSLPQWAEIELDAIITPTNKVGFILQLGYFKASGRFFKVETYLKDDFAFILRIYKIVEFDFTSFKEVYHKVDVFRHRPLILRNFGIIPFDIIQKEKLYLEAVRLLKKQANPRGVFYSLALFLRSNQVEIPTYFTIASVLTEAIRKRDAQLMEIINQNLSPNLQEIFDKMLSINEDSNEKRYLLTQLRKSKEVMKPNAIRANMKDYKSLKEYYQ